MTEIIDAADFVRILGGRHQGKTGIVKRKVEHSSRSTDYFVLVPSDDDIYRLNATDLEKIDQLPPTDPATKHT